MANTAWAFATLGVADQRLFEALASTARAKIRDFNAQNVANTACAFATQGVADRRLFEALAEAAMAKIRDFNAQDVANTAWAFATLGVADQRLFEALADAAMPKIQDFNAQNVANTAWAFALLYIHHEELFKQLVNRISQLKGSFSSSGLLQLHQVALALKTETPSRFALPPEVSLEIEKMKKELSAHPPASSRLHASVASQLKTLKYVFTTELFVEGFFLDIAFTERRIAVEVDGPSHYLSTGERSGSGLFRDRIIEWLGWRVVHIPYYEWDKLSAEEEQRKYLLEKMERSPSSSSLSSTPRLPAKSEKPVVFTHLAAPPQLNQESLSSLLP